MKRVFLLAGILGAVAAWAAETAVDPANRRINGTLTVVGATTLTGAISASSVDAGTLFVRGNEQHAGTMQGATKVDLLDGGAANFMGPVEFNRPLRCGANVVCGSTALSSGTPSTATVTVETGSSCACWPVGTSAAVAAGGCAANVSSTTLTLTGPDSVTTTMRYLCWL